MADKRNLKNPKIEEGFVTPEERERIRASMQGKEIAPSSLMQAGAFVNWKALQDQLGQPFDVERIPISKLKQMRRDPMIAFALHYVKSSLVRAPWHIEAHDQKGPNAQVAAFVDSCLRSIYQRFIFQYCLSLDFGFSAIAKRFAFGQPAGTFIDENGNEQPVWAEGNVDAIVWKPFVPMPPERVEPIWTTDGEFGGIKYTPPEDQAAGATKGRGGGGRAKKQDIEIDVEHSLWATNERDSVYGSIFGYPRTGAAFRYWWSYWFWWSLHDRHFEKDADPPTVVRGPEGKYETEDGEIVRYADIALEIGDRARSNSTIYLPSTVVAGLDERQTNLYEWTIEYLQGNQNFDAFLEAFNYVDTQKLRAVLVPEQSLIEGSGGTSSRNVAAEFGDRFHESQAVLMAEIDEVINRYVIPQLVAVNFPEFIGDVRKVTRGFQVEDIDFIKQVIQLVGEHDPASLAAADIPQALKNFGVPTLPKTQADERAQRLIAQAATGTNAPIVEPKSGQVGVQPRTPEGGDGGATANFSYVQPQERIVLSDADSFLTELPNSKHYSDKTMKALSAQLFKVWKDRYRQQYSSFADFIEQQDQIELADDTIKEKADRLVKRWLDDSNSIKKAVDKTTDIINKMVRRAASLELKNANLSNSEFDPEGDPVSEWVEAHVNSIAASVDDTVRNELSGFLIKDIEGGKEPSEIAQRVRSHFEDFPEWKAARVARTTARDSYNAGTLLSADSAGVKKVQAVDAQFGPTDSDCEDRDGEVFTIKQALNVDEHPNGTLAWKILNADVSVVTTEQLPDGVRGFYDKESQTVSLAPDLSDSERKKFLLELGESL